MGAGHAHALYVHEHSPIHRLAPEAKLVAAFAFVAAAAITPREAVWAFCLDAALLAAIIRIARLRAGFVLVRLVAILPFIAFALFIPFIASGEQVELWGISLSREGLWATWNIAAKATIGATTSIVLTATTELADILRGMAVLRVPSLLTSIAGFMIRYLELIAEELGRMRVAMTARGYDARWLWQVRPIAAAAGAMFIRSYERGERVYDAMLSRGYTGTMPDLTGGRAPRSDWMIAAPLPLVGLALALIALVVT